MADNKIHIAAGIIPNDTGEAESSNQFFIASGLIPTDKSVGPEVVYIRKLAGLTNISKINGISMMNIAKINGIEVA